MSIVISCLPLLFSSLLPIKVVPFSFTLRPSVIVALLGLSLLKKKEVTFFMHCQIAVIKSASSSDTFYLRSETNLRQFVLSDDKWYFPLHQNSFSFLSNGHVFPFKYPFPFFTLWRAQGKCSFFFLIATHCLSSLLAKRDQLVRVNNARYFSWKAKQEGRIWKHVLVTLNDFLHSMRFLRRGSAE